MLMASKVGGDQWLGNIYVPKVGGDASRGPNRLLRPCHSPIIIVIVIYGVAAQREGVVRSHSVVTQHS